VLHAAAFDFTLQRRVAVRELIVIRWEPEQGSATSAAGNEWRPSRDLPESEKPHVQPPARANEELRAQFVRYRALLQER
jgi:hypothetical protein